MLKALVVSTPGTKFAQQVGSFQDGLDEGEGGIGTTVHPISNPVGDAAMEGVKSKKVHGTQPADFPGENCYERGKR